MNQVCKGQPLSWLQLEQYQLRELPPAHLAQVETHLQTCPACRACLSALTQPSPLPNLVLPMDVPRRRSPVFLPWRWAWAAVAIGLAAGLAILVLSVPRIERAARTFPGSKLDIKGGELALGLVRERGGSFVHDPSTFVPTDRFKAVVTCPPDGVRYADLVVFQNETIFFPLPRQQVLSCGNRVPLQGAFALSGSEPVEVCLVVSSEPVDFNSSLDSGSMALPKESVCVALQPRY